MVGNVETAGIDAGNRTFSNLLHPLKVVLRPAEDTKILSGILIYVKLAQFANVVVRVKIVLFANGGKTMSCSE